MPPHRRRERKLSRALATQPPTPHGPLQPMVRGLTATDPVWVHTLLRSLISSNYCAPNATLGHNRHCSYRLLDPDMSEKLSKHQRKRRY
jgi:hypothetical protein